ncbi:MAG: ribonuclease J [Acidobacteria bacterium]|nr:ribonuclease J [Acidobacteriota bacterium]
MAYNYNPDTLQILPIGGVGEFGMNATLYRYNDTAILVDAGVMFPDTDQPGVNLIVPDYTVLNEVGVSGLIAGAVITHGHEDHIGGVPFLCRDLDRDMDIYGTRLTCGFIRKRLEEHRFNHKVELHEVAAGDTLSFGEIKVHLLRVTHSIVDCVALVIETPAGTAFHTGDFKVDQTPIDGKNFDFAGFAEWGRRGINLLLSDSTNIAKEGYTLSERTVGDSLRAIIKASRQKVIVACFSSHIHRIQQIVTIAKELNRRVVLLGRSLENSMSVARQLGYLKVPAGVMANKEEIRDIPEHRLIIITTGSQGEPMSALSRIVRGETKQVEIYPGDTIIISAKTIPGNEKSVMRIINSLYRMEAEVHYEEISEVHVSGHASREELKLVFSLLMPHNFVPIHGDRMQLVHHAALAKEMGLERRRVAVVDSGDILELAGDRVRKIDSIEVNRRFIEGDRFEELEDIALRDRRRLSEDGLIVVTLLVDETSAELVGDVEVITRGFLLLSDDEEEMAQIRDRVRRRFSELKRKDRLNWEAVRPKIRSALRSYFRKRMNSFPVVLPIILTVPGEKRK